MLEKALKGNRGYWIWIIFLLIIVSLGLWGYRQQLDYGLGVTGMSRDVSWGLYIAQFTFLVGVAASAVMLVLPYYLHDYKAFAKITVMGEFLAVSAVIMCIGFIFVDLGQPSRVMNVILHPTPNSILFWDMVVLSGYLIINMITGWVILSCTRNEVPPPGWLKPIIYLSIPWAISIHTVTAFIYAGLPGRTFWLTAIMAPRFLASAFASGPALLIVFCLILKRIGRFDAGEKAIQALAKIVAYALTVSIFFVLVEIFTVFYSGLPEHEAPFIYLFAGLHGHAHLVPWMWSFVVLSLAALIMLVIPPVRKKDGWLALACIFVFISLWIEKGLGLIIPGFIPSPLEKVTEYFPTKTEVAITMGIWAAGFLILSLLYKIFVGVRGDIDGQGDPGRHHRRRDLG